MADHCKCGGKLKPVRSTDNGWIFACEWCGINVELDDFWDAKAVILFSVLILCLIAAAVLEVPA